MCTYNKHIRMHMHLHASFNLIQSLPLPHLLGQHVHDIHRLHHRFHAAAGQSNAVCGGGGVKSGELLKNRLTGYLFGCFFVGWLVCVVTHAHAYTHIHMTHAHTHSSMHTHTHENTHAHVHLYVCSLAICRHICMCM